MGLAKALFSSAKYDWGTPEKVFRELDDEFAFVLDAAADHTNALCQLYFTESHDALTRSWHPYGTVFLNPPYGRSIGQWVAKAAEEARQGCTVVVLIPARTDTRYFHDYIWDKEHHCPKPGVQVRFLQGRLTFVGADNEAPFPSMVVVFEEVE